MVIIRIHLNSFVQKRHGKSEFLSSSHSSSSSSSSPSSFSSTMSASTSTSTSALPALCQLSSPSSLPTSQLSVHWDLNLGPAQLSVHRWTSSSVCTAGPQPGTVSAQCAPLTAGPQPGICPAQCAPLDLNRGPPQLSVHCWTSTDRMPEDMPDRMSDGMPEDMPDKIS